MSRQKKSGNPKNMFKCKECDSSEFQLVVQPECEALVNIQCNEFGEVIVAVNGQEFIADLMFMNQFAVCRDCGGIKNWEYFFPETAAAV